MFCENCKVEIPPAWVVIIAKNECPACGKEIMSSKTKELMDELSSAMQKMPNDPEGVAGWLLSNYRFEKIGAAEPTEMFHGKNNNSVVRSTGGSSAKLNQFFKNAGISSPFSRSKKGPDIIDSLEDDSGSDFEPIKPIVAKSSENKEQLSPEKIKEMKQLIIDMQKGLDSGAVESKDPINDDRLARLRKQTS